MAVRCTDLLEAVDWQRSTLARELDSDWNVPAHGVDASCRATLDHIVSSLTFYSVQLARSATSRLPELWRHSSDIPLEEMFDLVESAARILMAVANGVEPNARGFHPAGMADVEGFLAMACDELLVHTGDIALGLGISVSAPPRLCASVLERLFPWAPSETGAWETLLWANGRIPLIGHSRLDNNWYWLAVPVSEWDGIMVSRTAPPSWRP